MHKFTAILPLAASLLHGIAALPRLASPEHQVDIRSVDKILAPTVVGVYVCVDADYKGQCSYLQNPPGMCVNFDKTFTKAVTAIKPDERRVSGCKMFENPNCKGENLDVVYPGFPNLSKQPELNHFDNMFSSYICY